jgi:1,4-dihydroxy-6-naphthoate synthase
LLFQLFYSRSTLLRQVLFSDIMPRLQQGHADFGVCIHEGRFTWQSAGLNLVEDLGSRWETETGCPLPLGGILAKRSTDPDVLHRVVAVISDSITLALESPEQTLPTMRRYAQEFDDHVLMQHVDLYVNQWTQDLGQVGRQALRELAVRATAARLIPQDQPLLAVFE